MIETPRMLRKLRGKLSNMKMKHNIRTADLKKKGTGKKKSEKISTKKGKGFAHSTLGDLL